MKQSKNAVYQPYSNGKDASTVVSTKSTLDSCLKPSLTASPRPKTSSVYKESVFLRHQKLKIKNHKCDSLSDSKSKDTLNTFQAIQTFQDLPESPLRNLGLKYDNINSCFNKTQTNKHQKTVNPLSQSVQTNKRLINLNGQHINQPHKLPSAFTAFKKKLIYVNEVQSISCTPDLNPQRNGFCCQTTIMLKNKIAEMQQEMLKKNQDIETLKRNIRNTKIYETEKEIRVYQEECQRLRDLLEKLAKSKDKYADPKELQLVEESFQKRDKKIKQLESDNQTLMIQVQELKEQTKKYLSQISEKQTQIDNFEKKNSRKSGSCETRTSLEGLNLQRSKMDLEQKELILKLQKEMADLKIEQRQENVALRNAYLMKLKVEMQAKIDEKVNQLKESQAELAKVKIDLNRYKQMSQQQNISVADYQKHGSAPVKIQNYNQKHSVEAMKKRKDLNGGGKDPASATVDKHQSPNHKPSSSSLTQKRLNQNLVQQPQDKFRKDLQSEANPNSQSENYLKLQLQPEKQKQQTKDKNLQEIKQDQHQMMSENTQNAQQIEIKQQPNDQQSSSEKYTSRSNTSGENNCVKGTHLSGTNGVQKNIDNESDHYTSMSSQRDEHQAT